MYSTVCCYMAGATWNCCRHSLGARSLYIILPYTMLRPHFMQSYLHRVHSCLAVTCILHLQQNDQCYYSNTAGGTDTEKKKKKKKKESRYRKLALEKKIRPPLLPELEPATFWSRVRQGPPHHSSARDSIAGDKNQMATRKRLAPLASASHA